MTIPNRVFVERAPPDNGIFALPGAGMSAWPLSGGSKHWGITYIPEKKLLYFVGGDGNSVTPCNGAATNYGYSYTYDALLDSQGDPQKGWRIVGGDCRAAGQISPLGLDQPPCAYDPKRKVVWTCSAKSNETSHPTSEVICTCTDAGDGIPRAAGALRQRGVYRVDPYSADQLNWPFFLEIYAGTVAPNYTENMLGWQDSLKYDNATDSLVTMGEAVVVSSNPNIGAESGALFCSFPLSKSNRTIYSRPNDPDWVSGCSGPQIGGVGDNHVAFDPVGRWLYYLVGSSVYDPATCDQLAIDPRQVTTWDPGWIQYPYPVTFVSGTQYQVGGNTSYFYANQIVKLTCSAGDRTGKLTSVVYQAGSDTSLITVGELSGPLDSGLSVAYYDPRQTLCPARFWRFNLDTHVYQKLPDPPTRLYTPSASLQGGPFYHNGNSTEIDLIWDSKNRAVIYFDHGLWGTGGKMEAVYVWDTTLLTDQGKIRQWDGASITFPIYTTLTNLRHPAWQSFPVTSTGTWLVEVNEQYYDPGQNITVLGGSNSGITPSIRAFWWWRYK